MAMIELARHLNLARVLIAFILLYMVPPHEAIKILPNMTFDMYRQGRSTWVLKDGKRHVIPDRYTLNRLGFQFHELKHLNKTLMDAYPKADGVETLWDHHENAALMSLLKTGPHLVKETYKVFHRLLNPSIVFWKDDLFISGRWADDPQFQTIFWFNKNSSYDHTLSLEEGLKTMSYTSSFKFNTSIHPYGKIFGEDPRLFKLSDDRLYCVICHRFPRKKPELQMAYSVLRPVNNKIEVDPLVDIKYQEFPKEDQKNWSPFEYNKKMLFIATVQPHRIVETVPDDKKMWVAHGKTVALSKIKNLKWKYGDLRGGTTGIYIGNHTNLAFFHSSNEPPATGDVLRTYVFGAYTFDSRPPFAIKAMSPNPIVHEAMYSGPWANLPLSYYHIDYIAFPMAFVIENGFVVLLYGKQDSDSWVAKIELNGLLNSLAPVESQVLVNNPV